MVHGSSVTASKRVTLRVSTSPAGAEVIRLGKKNRVLGLTPFRLKVRPADETWKLKVRLDGYREKPFELSLAKGNQRVSLTLERVSKPAAPAPVMRSKRAVRRVRRRPMRRRTRQMGTARGTIDPF
jgi:hypothetical protein